MVIDITGEEAKLLSTLINKELLEYKHVPNKEGGSFHNLLTTTLSKLDSTKESTRTPSRRQSTI